MVLKRRDNTQRPNQGRGVKDNRKRLGLEHPHTEKLTREFEGFPVEILENRPRGVYKTI